MLDATTVSARGSFLDPRVLAGVPVTRSPAARAAVLALAAVYAAADNAGSLEAERAGSDAARALDFSRAAALTETSSALPPPLEAGALVSGAAASAADSRGTTGSPGSTVLRGTTGSGAGSSEDVEVACAG